MGQDKSQLTYHDVAQEVYVARMCAELGLETWISKASHYPEDFIKEFPVLRDHVSDQGPLGGVGTAMRQDPQAAWLMLACDLPFLTKDLIAQLIEARVPEQAGTVVHIPEDDRLEPLVAIYEPRILFVVLERLSRGQLSPMKMIRSFPFHFLEVEDIAQLQNVNTPEELEETMNTLNGN